MNRFGIDKKTFWYSRELILALFLVIIVLSFFMYVTNDEKKRRIILFFPEDNLVEVSGDFHIVPLKKTVEENMKMTLSEALLHPFDYRLNPIVPDNVKINSFIFNQEEKTLFVDLSLELIGVGSSNSHLIDGEVMLDILEKNLLFNHRSLRDVQFSIEGEVPFSPVFQLNKD